MTNEEIGYVIERIEYLEKIFDEVQNSFKNDQNFFENKKMEVKVSLLTQYLESGQWLRDFELDEKGKLPSDLKRGILSEDGLYNLIADIEQTKRKKSIRFTPFWKYIFKEDRIRSNREEEKYS